MSDIAVERIRHSRRFKIGWCEEVKILVEFEL